MPKTIWKVISHVKGAQIGGWKSGKAVFAKNGMWRLKANEQIPENQDAQVAEILGKLSSDLNIWHQIAAKYSIDLFVGLLMNESNEGGGTVCTFTRIR